MPKLHITIEYDVCRHEAFRVEEIMTKIRLDFVPCLLIGVLLCWLTIFAGQKYVEMADERYETQELPQGEVGGVPAEDTPLVESIAEMK